MFPTKTKDLGNQGVLTNDWLCKFRILNLCAYSLLSTIFATASYNGPDSDLVAVLATTDT